MLYEGYIIVIRIGWAIGLWLVMSFQGNVYGAETINIVYFQHKPHSYLDEKTGEPRGASINYFEQVAARMGYDVNWIGPLPLARMILCLEQAELGGQRIDGQVHELKFSEYEPFLYYGDQPYHKAYSVLVVKDKDRLTEIKDVNDILCYRIGWLIDVPPSKCLAGAVNDFQFHLMPMTDTKWQQLLKMLDADRIDAIHELNEYTLAFEAETMGMGERIKTLRLPDEPDHVYVTFCKHSVKGKELIDAYNRVQAEMNFQHEDYVKLIEKEFEALETSEDIEED